MKLRYAPRARNEIADIHAYISEHNPSAATAVVRAIRATANLLARHPGVGRDIVVHVRHGSRSTLTKQNV